MITNSKTLIEVYNRRIIYIIDHFYLVTLGPCDSVGGLVYCKKLYHDSNKLASHDSQDYYSLILYTYDVLLHAFIE